MSKFSERLRELRNYAKLTQQELSEKIGMSKSSVNMYERGEREPGLETLELIADFFNVDLDYLMGKTNIKKRNDFKNSDNITGISIMNSDKIRMIPLFNSVSAGFGAYPDECVVEYMPVYIEHDYDAENMLAVTVEGDSMYPKIEDGDVVVVRKQSDYENGDIVVAIIDKNEAFVKKIYDDGEEITLVSINPEYKNKVYKGADRTYIEVVGVVKKIIKEV